MKPTVLYDPIFKFEWVIFYGGTEQAAVDWFSKLLNVEKFAVDFNKNRHGCFMAFHPFKNGMFWFPNKYPAASVVAHEAFHGVKYIYDTLKIELVDRTEESWAYYLEWLVQNIYRRPKR